MQQGEGAGDAYQRDADEQDAYQQASRWRISARYFTKERLQSFNYSGPLLFNSLPLYLRTDVMSTVQWKTHLDKFLDSIPDNPITIKVTSGLRDVITYKPTNLLT